MSAFGNLIQPFIASIADGSVEIYNEISLQHELGIFLRGTHPASHVRFERNVGELFPGLSFSKREIDIVLRGQEDGRLEWAIELKYPRNGQYPEQMFSICRDVAFVEEPKAAGFAHAGLLILAEDAPFFRGSTEGIYGYFRGGRPLCGRIQKPTGAKDAEVVLRGMYVLEWVNVPDRLRYLAIEA